MANTVTTTRIVVGAKTLWTESYSSDDVTGNPVIRTRSANAAASYLTKVLIHASTVASSNSFWVGDSGTKVLGDIPMIVSSNVLFEANFEKNPLKFVSSINLDQDNADRIHSD